MKTNRWDGFNEVELNHLHISTRMASENFYAIRPLAEEIDKEEERRLNEVARWRPFKNKDLRVLFGALHLACNQGDDYQTKDESEFRDQIEKEINKRRVNIDD